MYNEKITSSKSAIEANNIPVEKKKKRKKKRDKILRNIQLGPDARYYRLTVRKKKSLQVFIYFI